MKNKFKFDNMQIAYESSVEDINKKLKEDIILALKQYTGFFNTLIISLFSFIIYTFASAVTVLSVYALFLLVTGNISSFSIRGILKPSPAIFTMLFIILFSIYFIKSLIGQRSSARDLVADADTLSYEDLFSAYESLMDSEYFVCSLFTFVKDLTFYHRDYCYIKDELIPSLISIENNSSSTSSEIIVTKKKENGDVEVIHVPVEEIITNTDVTCPEIRFSAGYKRALVIPFKENDE